MASHDFFNIRVGTLRANEALPFDLFVVVNAKHVHYLRSGDSLSDEKIKKFDNSDQFRIPSDQRQNYKDFISSKMNKSDISTKEKASILRESSLSLVEEIFENADIGQALEGSKDIINDFVNFMDREADGMGNLISLSSHDFYTYNHSLDVGVYCLGLGKKVGFMGDELTEMGRGALFHDIGKRWVDADIICKDGPLDDEEWVQMRKHPEYGLKILSDHNDVSEAIKACCYEHHESFLGNGYPQQLDGNEIHPMARMVAISDTYDALTTQRSYNKPMTPKAALEFITTKLKDRYDPDFMKAMREIITQLQD